MYKVLVTGSNGQLGSEIKDLSQNYNYEFFFESKENLDITNENIVEKFILENKIDVIINCAAYTAVDKAEEDFISADLINHLSVKNLAKISRVNHIKLIHISTDYVFDGKTYIPYTEDDIPNPLSKYAKSKLDGENAIINENPLNSIIIRSSWVYSTFGHNFVKTMLKLGREREYLNVVFDQIGTPTYARDLADVILEILPKIKNDKVEIYNYSNEGVTSWYDFAVEIMKIAKLDCKVKPIESKEYNVLAKRPYYCLLNKKKIKSKYNIKIANWRDSLNSFFDIEYTKDYK